jgi:RimJ/RimL family protein N-acetyltransferase
MHIELYRLVETDLQPLISIINKQVAHDANIQWPFTKEVAKNFITNYNTWGIRVNTKLVGAIELKRDCEVAYFIAPAYQNKGIATAALEIMINNFADRQLVAYIHPNNKASLRVAQKAKLRVHFLQ